MLHDSSTIKCETVVHSASFTSQVIDFYIFFTPFHWSLSDTKSAQVSGTLFSILTDFNFAVIWMVFIVLLFAITPIFVPIFW